MSQTIGYPPTRTTSSFNASSGYQSSRPTPHQFWPFCYHSCDCYGDHLFFCGFSKKCKSSLHKHICDTLYTILFLLASLAGLARTANRIQCEPKNRLPNHPQCCPLDVVIDLITPTNAAAVSVRHGPYYSPYFEEPLQEVLPFNPSNLKDSLGQHPLETTRKVIRICSRR
jgi:hypothetical protein